MRLMYMLSFFVLCLSEVYGQTQIEGTLNFHGFADNREYNKSGRKSQTILGSRLGADVGLLIDSTHRVRIGANVLQEFGDKVFARSVVPTIYYQYLYKHWDFYLGAFPRYPLLADYPRIMLNDTLQYYRPNLEGMLLKYQSNKFKGSFWIDWTGKQSQDTRETFLVGLDARLTLGKFFIRHYGYMYHKAFSENPANEFLEDNGFGLLLAGVNLKNVTFLDSLSVSVGSSVSFERVRSLTSMNTPRGFMSNIEAYYKQFFLENSFYTGKGHHLILGDSFYNAKLYDRVDLGWTPLKGRNLEGKLKLTFHFVDGKIDNQQSFVLRYKIAGSKKVGK